MSIRPAVQIFKDQRHSSLVFPKFSIFYAVSVSFSGKYHIILGTN